jgi:tetratricopeptide (TPR) repeat protein
VSHIKPDDFKRMQENLKKFSQCMSLGKYAQAQQILNEHRIDIENNFDADHPAQLSVDNNQALLLKLDGNPQEAKQMFKRCIEKYALFYGEQHPSYINALINLASVHKDLGENKEAIPLYEKAIEGRIAVEGPDSTQVAMAKAMAAGAYRDCEQYDKADLYLKDAYLKVALEYGEDTVSASVILNSQGLLYKKQGKYERAKDNYERSLDIR